MGKFKDFLKTKGPKLLKAGIQTVIPGGSLLSSLESDTLTQGGTVKGEINREQLIKGLTKDVIKLVLWILVITGKLGWEEAEQASEFLFDE